jgi:hypothetical protein
VDVDRNDHGNGGSVQMDNEELEKIADDNLIASQANQPRTMNKNSLRSFRSINGGHDKPAWKRQLSAMRAKDTRQKNHPK